MAIAECLAVVLEALPHSSLSPARQLLWVIDHLLEDEYSLLAAGEREKARQWCLHGYATTVEAARGIADRLRETLCELALAEGRHGLAAAYRAEAFFAQPSLAHYPELQAAAEQAGHWPAVRAATLAFLETGQRPDVGGAPQEAPLWPLPPTGLARLPGETSSVFRRFPELDLMIGIAILEQRLDDVVVLYRRLPKTPSWD